MSCEDSEELDPRVQVELENLNVCTDEINRLEVQLDEASAQFRIALVECTQRLKYFAEKLGTCVEKAKPYYDAVELARKEQIECQKAAIQFQRASSLYASAKERIAQAERRFQNKSEDCQFDTVWQDMLNHDTSKLMMAEIQRSESEKEHEYRASLFAKVERNVHVLEQKLRSAITKSKPYFENKRFFQNELKLLKERVHSLQKTVTEAKERYSQALRNLETISEEIHEKRKPRLPREPGVGAEMVNLSDYESLLRHIDCQPLDSVDLGSFEDLRSCVEPACSNAYPVEKDLSSADPELWSLGEEFSKSIHICANDTDVAGEREPAAQSKITEAHFGE